MGLGDAGTLLRAGGSGRIENKSLRGEKQPLERHSTGSLGTPSGADGNGMEGLGNIRRAIGVKSFTWGYGSLLCSLVACKEPLWGQQPSSHAD